jgi:putative ABC transport system permease protein
MQPVVETLKQVAEPRGTERYNKLMREGQAELDDARSKLASGQRELKDAEDELAAAGASLDAAWADLESGRASLDNGWSQLHGSRAELDSSWAQLDAAKAQLDAAKAALESESESAGQRLASEQAQLEAGLELWQQGYAQWQQQYAQWQYAANNGLLPPDQLAAAQAQLEAAKAELDSGWSQLDAAKSQLEDARAAADAELAAAHAELEQGERDLANSRQRLTSGEDDYNRGLAQLQANELEYANGLTSYYDNKAEYESALAEFQAKYASSLAELASAEAEIATGEADLAALEQPRWYVLDLKSNAGFRSFSEESSQMEAIATIIPILFFLIAALVSMTAMTRLVDSDRTVIGTYKALGYSNAAISVRYLAYSLTASLIGSVVGVFVGFNLFPPLIFNAFRTMFAVPPGPPPFSWEYSVISVAIALVSTVVPSFLVSVRTLRETPASAMRPLAPSAGKRILMERVGPLWRRLSFLHKVTVRNLFRYKKRMLMTVIGVAGCTALMFTGFGLNDSLATIGPKQFNEIQRYDVAVTLDQGAASANGLTELDDFIAGSGTLDAHTELLRENMSVMVDSVSGGSGGSGVSKDVTVMVPFEPASINEYYLLQPPAATIPLLGFPLPGRETAAPLQLGDEGVVISMQLANQLGVGVGDALTLRSLEDKEAQLTVAGVAENYVYHYVFMTPDQYENSFGKLPQPNQLLGLFAEGSTALPEAVTELSVVTGLAYTQKSLDDFAEITDVLTFVMVILILSAAALVCVVLFSLNTINMEERARELASIKVLGFYNRELIAYVYREGFILTALGILLGLVLGVILERYIITTIEVDVFVFSLDLLWTSYVFSALLTAVFAVAVNLLMYRRITTINMVLSLKAIE